VQVPTATDSFVLYPQKKFSAQNNNPKAKASEQNRKINRERGTFELRNPSPHGGGLLVGADSDLPLPVPALPAQVEFSSSLPHSQDSMLLLAVSCEI
jgi:hypothetical protein